MKIRVGVFFGGKSVEHEVSVISGLQAYNAFNKEKYDLVPIYITKENELYTGEAIADIANYRNIPELLKKSARVFLQFRGGADRRGVSRGARRECGGRLPAGIFEALQYPVRGL